MLYIIAGMNPKPSVVRLQRKIAAVRAALGALGAMHPGSVSRQYQVCGRPGCRCLDPHQPRRHGPYHKLAYVHRGQPVCRFVRAACVGEVSQRLAVYKRFRKLIQQWIALSIQQGQVEFFNPAATRRAKAARPPATHRPGTKRNQA